MQLCVVYIVFGVSRHTVATLHDHLSGWKVDLDVLGVENSVRRTVTATSLQALTGNTYVVCYSQCKLEHGKKLWQMPDSLEHRPLHGIEDLS